MEFKFSDEMQKAADKFANNGLLAKYEKSLNIENFSEMGKKRKMLQGVFHRNGKQIATDGRILIAVKENYEKEFEGLKTSTRFDFTDDEEREFVDNWEKVIPDVENSKTEIFSYDDFTQLEKLAVVSQIMTDHRCDFKCTALVKIGTLFFCAKYVFMLCVMAKKYGLHNVLLNQNFNSLRVFGDNGDIVLASFYKSDGDKFYFDFENSQKIEIGKYTEEIIEIKNPFNFKIKFNSKIKNIKKFKPRKIAVTKTIKPNDCPMCNDDCTDCQFNKDYDEWEDKVICAYEEDEEDM